MLHLAHQPYLFLIVNVPTGEHWYLEQMQMWAGAMSCCCPILADQRGPNGYAGIVDQVRGDAGASQLGEPGVLC